MTFKLFRLIALLITMPWIIPSPVIEPGSLPVQSFSYISAEQIDGSADVSISLLMETPPGVSIASHQFFFKERPRRPWQPVEIQLLEEGFSPGLEQTARWHPLDDDLQVETREAQIKLVVFVEPGAEISVSSAEFSLDTKPPLGCSCGYPGYETQDVPLDTLFVATVPRIDHSPPFQYRFRLGADGEATPLVTGPWQERSTWSAEILEPASRYWWQVQARDRYNNVAEWSPPIFFSTLAGVSAEDIPAPEFESSLPARIAVYVMVAAMFLAVLLLFMRRRRRL